MRLSQFAFQYELSPADLADRLERLKPEETWGAFVDGRLAAKMTILPLETYIGGRVFRMGGLAGVATWPEHRRGGLVAGLLGNALKVMRGQGQTVSFLHPFQFAFYRKYGWETYTDYKKYEISTEQLPSFERPAGRMERGADWQVLDRIYHAYASRFNGSLVRTEKWWSWNILAMKNKGGAAAVYYGEDGSPKGYILYKVKESVMTVAELVCLDDEARRGLWTFIRNHDSMMAKVELQGPVSDRLTYFLANPRIKQEVVSYFMARIVDVKAFVEAYPFASGVDGEFRLRVKDPHADWNEGLFAVKVDREGAARVERNPDDPAQADGGGLCETDIQSLSALLMGYVRPRFLYDAGKLHGDPKTIELLEAILPADRETYLPDFF